jgi:hypothetical protein
MSSTTAATAAEPPRRWSRSEAKAPARRLRFGPALGALLAIGVAGGAAGADTRALSRCVCEGAVSLASTPKLGARCVARQIDYEAAKAPKLSRAVGVVNGTLYEHQQGGKTLFSTRRVPGSVKVFSCAVVGTAPGEPAGSAGFGHVAALRLDRHAAQFRAAARATGVDDAWLRAIAHAESNFDPNAVSAKGALGVMQLMPQTARDYGVADPFSSAQSISAGARHLKALLRRYHGDFTLAAAAYNAGIGAVTRYGGVPPFAETRDYIARVNALHARYRAALGAGRTQPASVAEVSAP